jgi:hypothetical protein
LFFGFAENFSALGAKPTMEIFCANLSGSWTRGGAIDIAGCASGRAHGYATARAQLFDAQFCWRG